MFNISESDKIKMTKELSDNLTLLRKTMKLSQSEFGNYIGVTRKSNPFML